MNEQQARDAMLVKFAEYENRIAALEQRNAELLSQAKRVIVAFEYPFRGELPSEMARLRKLITKAEGE